MSDASSEVVGCCHLTTKQVITAVNFTLETNEQVCVGFVFIFCPTFMQKYCDLNEKKKSDSDVTWKWSGCQMIVF